MIATSTASRRACLPSIVPCRLMQSPVLLIRRLPEEPAESAHIMVHGFGRRHHMRA
jgi:hypothetical protein